MYKKRAKAVLLFLVLVEKDHDGCAPFRKLNSKPIHGTHQIHNNEYDIRMITFVSV